MVDQTELEPPTFQRAGRVQVHTPDGTKVAGYHGTIPERESNGFLSDRNSHKHRIRALDSYAFSITLVDTLKALDPGFVLVRETDTGDVYEWKAEALFYADEVPDQFLEHADDPQLHLPRESARAIWRSGGAGLVEKPEPPESDPEFTKASDLSDNDPDPDDLTEEERLELAFERGEGG